MAAFYGMRGTGDWATDQRPKNWRETIFYLYPNGAAPLTAMLSKMKSEKVDDPEFNWWTKTLPSQGGAVTGVYTDAALSSAYTSGGVAGSILYIKMALALSKEFRVGHQVLLRDASDYEVDVNAKVLSVVHNGASSYVCVKLLEADDNGTTLTHDLSDCDTILIVGNVNPEGGSLPDAIAYDPTKWTNYTQIFRTSLSITRTARRTRLRTGDAYKEAKRECLELHSIEMEKAFMWSVATEGTGSNGKPERTTLGLVPAIKAGAASNCNDYSLNSTYTGQTWLSGGETWLNIMLEQMFRYGSKQRLAFCGSGTLLGINNLVLANGQFSISTATRSYGVQVTEWVTAFGRIDLITHPLFSYQATNRYSMAIFEPEKLKYRYIDDTTFYGESDKQNTGAARVDATDEEFLTECGLEYQDPIGWGFLNGVGVDSVV